MILSPRHYVPYSTITVSERPPKVKASQAVHDRASSQAQLIRTLREEKVSGRPYGGGDHNKGTLRVSFAPTRQGGSALPPGTRPSSAPPTRFFGHERVRPDA